MRKTWRRIASVILALAMVVLTLPEYVSPVKKAKAEATQKRIFVRTDSLTSGHNYLIVNTNVVGSAYALTRSDGSTAASRSQVTILAANTDSDAEDVYIAEASENAIWSTEIEDDAMRLKNGEYYLQVYGTSGQSTLAITKDPYEDEYYSHFSWSYANEHRLMVTYHNGHHNPNWQSDTSTRYIQYQNQGGFSGTTNAATIYIYEELLVCNHEYTYDGMVWNSQWLLGEEIVTASAKFVCTGCDDVVTIDAEIKSEEVSADSCDDVPAVKYTATVSKDDAPDGEKHEDEKVFSLKVEDTTQSVTGSVYVLKTTITPGKNYLIVSTNAAGSAHALANGFPEASSNNNTAVKDRIVTVAQGPLTIGGTTSNNVYIKVADTDAVWKITGTNSTNGYTIQNGEYYLFHTSGSDSSIAYLDTTGESTYRGWSISAGNNSYLRYQGTNRSYYVYFKNENNPWERIPRANNGNGNILGHVYFFEETEITMPGYKEAEATGHQFPLTEVDRVEPTCEQPGTEKHWKCKRCQAIFSDEDGTTTTTEDALKIDALGHNWVWNGFDNWVGNDVNGYTKATATYVCSREATHTETVTNPSVEVNVTDEVIDPTETSPAKRRYTASISAEDTLESENKTAHSDYKEVNCFLVTFVDENDNQVGDAKYYNEGTPASSIIVPEAPDKDPDEQYEYAFDAWKNGESGITDVTEDATYKATYKVAKTVEYDVYWIVDGHESVTQVPYGQSPVFNGTPSKGEDETHTYEFEGWKSGEDFYGVNDTLPAVEGDVTYVAQFKEIFKEYTVTWNIDGNETTSTAHYGASPVYNGGVNPTKPAEGDVVYTFEGWQPVGSQTVYGPQDTLPAVVDNNSYYTAVFKATTFYTIDIDDAQNGTIRTNQSDNKAEAGETVTLTFEPAQGGYELLSYWVEGPNGEIPCDTTSGITFTMPAGAVAVHAVFGKYFPVWIVGTQITTANQDNVLGDAAGSERITFSETTDKYVLTILTGDEITLDNNADVWSSAQKALIYVADTAAKPLEIVANKGLTLSSETAYHGIYNESGYDLTVNGNVSIKLASEIEGGQELNGIYCLTSSMTITGDVTLNFPNGKYGNGNGLFAGDGCDITISGDVDITGAGSNAIRCVKLTVEGKKLSIKGLTDERYDYGISAEDTISIKCDGDGVAILAQTYAICCAGDVEITGDVDATGKWNNAIESDGNVTIKGNVFLGSDGNGIYAENIDITGDVSNNNYGIGGSLLYCYNGDITVDGSIKADCPTGYLLYARTMSETKGKITVTKDITGLKGGSAETADGITAWAGITINGNVDMQVTNEGPVIGDVADNVKHYGINAGIGDLKIDGTLKLICAETVDYGLYVVNGATGNGTVTLSDEVSITMSSGGYGICATGTITLPEARTEISTNEGTAVFMSNIGENDIVIPEGYGISTPEDGEVRVIVDATDYDFYTIVDPASPDVAASVVVIEPYIEVQFVNADEDQTVLATTKGFVGKAPKYTGETPTKKETDAETYTFDGWSYGEATYASDDLPTITEDMTGPVIFTAAYLVETKQYEVTFYDEDGKTVLLETATYDYGTKPEDITTPGAPTKKDDDQYTYEFEGWDPELAEVTKNAAYTAKYKKVLKEFTIKFVNEDGKELQSTKVAYGTTPTFTGTTPTKEETAQFRYVFDGWTPGIVEVTGEATYTAKFAEKTKSYTIKFVNEDGTELQSSAVDYGKKPEYTGATPTKAADSQYTYTFKEWSPEIVTVTGEATYKATYDKKEISADDPVEEKGEYQLIGDKKISYKQKSGAVIKAQIKCTLHDENTFSKHKDVKSSKRTLVEGVDYKKTKGSVIIEFLPEYLDSLEVGSTMITVSFEDGNDVEIELEILPADAEEQKESPKTDDSMVFAWIIFLIGAASFSFMLIAKKREREERVGL